MFQKPRLSRNAVLSLAAYTVAACVAIAIMVVTWHYNQRIAVLEERVVTLRRHNTDLRRDYSAVTEATWGNYVWKFATTLMSSLPRDANLSSNTLRHMTTAALSELTSQPFGIDSMCVKYYPHDPSTDSRNRTPVIVSSRLADTASLCQETPNPDNLKVRHLPDNVHLAAVKDDRGSTAHFTAAKLDDAYEIVWLVAITPEPPALHFVGSTEDLESTSYPYLPAWVNSMTILLSLGVAWFVTSSGRRLARTARRLASVSGVLGKIIQHLHDARLIMGNMSWDGFHDLDGASARRLADVKSQVDSVYSELAKPWEDANASLSAANWLRKKVAAWDGGGEFIDFAEIARRIVRDEAQAAQKPIDVDMKDAIAQQISEYDAVTLLRNLIGNAFKHGEPPVAVTVRRTVIGPYQKEPAVEVVIVNDGKPYDKEIAERKGHGLKIVEDLAKKYHGDFKIAPGRNGRGAVARLFLEI